MKQEVIASVYGSSGQPTATTNQTFSLMPTVNRWGATGNGPKPVAITAAEAPSKHIDDEILQRAMATCPVSTLKRLRQEQRDKIMAQRRRAQKFKQSLSSIPACAPMADVGGSSVVEVPLSTPQLFNFKCPCGQIHVRPTSSGNGTVATPVTPKFHQCTNMPATITNPPMALRGRVSFAGMTGMRGTRASYTDPEEHYRKIMTMAERFIELSIQHGEIVDNEEVLPCGLTWAQVMDLQTRDISQEDYDALLVLDDQIPKKTVPKEIIDSLPVVPFSEIKQYADNDNEDMVCVICMCDFDEDDEIKSTPCRHLFHANCIARWLGEWGQTCPSCKKKIVEEEEEEQEQETNDDGHDDAVAKDFTFAASQSPGNDGRAEDDEFSPEGFSGDEF